LAADRPFAARCAALAGRGGTCPRASARRRSRSGHVPVYMVLEFCLELTTSAYFIVAEREYIEREVSSFQRRLISHLT
jgi:hypothetical protein